MLKRRLGRTDLDVSVLCFGGNVFGWTTDAAQSAAMLDAFVEAGGVSLQLDDEAITTLAKASA